MLQYFGHEIGEALRLGVSEDGEGVARDGGLHFGLLEVDNGAVVLEEVHLVDALEGLHAVLLDNLLELLVVIDLRVIIEGT